MHTGMPGEPTNRYGHLWMEMYWRWKFRTKVQALPLPQQLSMDTSRLAGMKRVRAWGYFLGEE
jgi:hypothetical protein